VIPPSSGVVYLKKKSQKISRGLNELQNIPTIKKKDEWKTEGRFLSTSSFISQNGNDYIITIGGLGLEREKNRYPEIEYISNLGVKKIPKSEKDEFYTNKQRWGHSASVINSISNQNIFLIGGFDHQCM